MRFDAGLVEVKPPSDLDLQGVAAERGLAVGQCRKTAGVRGVPGRGVAAGAEQAVDHAFRREAAGDEPRHQTEQGGHQQHAEQPVGREVALRHGRARRKSVAQMRQPRAELDQRAEQADQQEGLHQGLAGELIGSVVGPQRLHQQPVDEPDHHHALGADPDPQIGQRGQQRAAEQARAEDDHRQLEASRLVVVVRQQHHRHQHADRDAEHARHGVQARGAAEVVGREGGVHGDGAQACGGGRRPEVSTRFRPLRRGVRAPGCGPCARPAAAC